MPGQEVALPGTRAVEAEDREDVASEAAPDEGAAEFIARRVRDLARELEARSTDALGSDDPEAVHKARVATRRLRALLIEFDPYVPATIRAKIGGLKKAGRRLGVVRDLDVLVAAFTARPDAVEFELVIRELTEREAKERRALRRYLARSGFSDLLATLSSAEPESLAGPTALEAFREAEARLARVESAACDRLAGDPSDPSLHLLRIVHKRFRYLLESVRDLNPLPLAARDLKRRVRYHRDLQDRLGAHQDAVVRLETVAAMVPAHPGLSRQAVRLLDELDESRRAMLELLGVAWVEP
ncbi:MAG: CHAD domain-containing protein [Fimbriimonadaceae bacterium]|nr:CHAD domain-containing protein [Fimbriimonadaceae bacterium]